MPNHITSQVEIKATPAKIKKLIKNTKIKLETDIDDNQFDFNGIKKMPKSLDIETGSNLQLGMSALSQEHYDNDTVASKAQWWDERYPGVTNAEQLKAYIEENGTDPERQGLKTAVIALDNLKKYGYKDWYDWSYPNWGTKWNAYNVNYITHADDKLVIEIDTAWDTPRGIWDELEAQGYTVRGVMYGEMDGYDYIGDDVGDVFDAYQDVTVEYIG